MGLLTRLRTWRRYTVTARYRSPIDVPDQLRRFDLTLTGTPGHPKWLIFECPCQRGHRVMLNLDTRTRPAWRLNDATDPRATITPSIDQRSADGHCHYWITRGRVRWVEEEHRP